MIDPVLGPSLVFGGVRSDTNVSLSLEVASENRRKIQVSKGQLMTTISSRHCRHCRKQVPAVRNPPNHVLHALITFFLCGIWLPIWILNCIIHDWRCPTCGNKLPTASDHFASFVLISLSVLVALIAVGSMVALMTQL
jgi:hypothetical protein